MLVAMSSRSLLTLSPDKGSKGSLVYFDLLLVLLPFHDGMI